MMGEMNGMDWWMPGMGGIFMILWWGLIVAIVAVTARWFMSFQRDGGPETGALEVLNVRYARGEIGRQDYEAARHDIGRSRGM